MSKALAKALGILAVPVLAAAGLSSCTAAKPSPLRCLVIASPGKVLTNKTETLTVHSAAGASVTSTVRYVGTKGYVRFFRANVFGVGTTQYASGSGPGTVSVSARVVLGSRSGTCATSFVTVKVSTPKPKPPVNGPPPPTIPPPPITPATNTCDSQLYPANQTFVKDGLYARPQEVLNIQTSSLPCEFTPILTKEAAASYDPVASPSYSSNGFICVHLGLSYLPNGAHYVCKYGLSNDTITFDIVGVPLVSCGTNPFNSGQAVWVSNTTCGEAEATINVPRSPQGGGDVFLSGDYVCSEPVNPIPATATSQNYWDTLHHRCYTSDYMHAIFYNDIGVAPPTLP